MFGRVRASSVPADSLERPPSKIFKDDSLSIYETTLMKLRLGSKRNLSLCSNSSSLELEPMNIEVNCASSGTSSSPDLVAASPQEEVMTLDMDCSSERSSITSSDCDSVGTLKQPRSAEVSILYLFSKFKRAHTAVSSSSGEAMTIDSVRRFPKF
ncbi:uncharacterized protein LOC126795081 [Argentina anserina]|uniref:uncharacterized protein LOC126795081 n=1 Tax=Argentina anserina TaxID=57926 RepID=UPI00217626E5|nr:uncharacterized protein LOC126795081 [Potentilla anserina]